MNGEIEMLDMLYALIVLDLYVHCFTYQPCEIIKKLEWLESLSKHNHTIHRTTLVVFGFIELVINGLYMECNL